MKLEDADVPSLLFTEQGAAPATPATGKWRPFFKSDGFYVVDDAGAVSGPFGTAADLAAHLADTADAHDASAISYAGGTGISATDVEAAIDELAAEKADLASPVFTGEPAAPSVQASGKTGATATPIRLAGGTASGAPASGAHLKGEIVWDDAGAGYYCTVAGTPGTWVSFGGGGGGGGSVATDAIFDAKGDLAVGTGADTAAKLTAAANDGILTTDSAQATGLKYITRATLAADAAFSGTYLPLTKQPVMVTGIGAGGGDNSTSSSTFGDIVAALTCSVPAATGDRLLLTLECQHYHSLGAGQLRIKFMAAGTLISGQPTNGLYTVSGSSDSRYDAFSWPYTVQAGDISGGNVSVKPQFATASGTVSVRNDTTNGLPFMRVLNMRQ